MMPHPTLLDQTADGTDPGAGAPSAAAPAAPAAAQPAAAAPAPAAVQWPDNWREAYAGGDAKKLSRLQRYASPTAALDAMLAAQQKISSGEFRANTPFPEKGTPEEQASWRAERGIPTEPTGYDLTLGDGIVLGDEDKPAVDSFLKSAHAANVPADAAKAALKWYHEFKTTQAEQIYERDVAWKEEAEEALRAEWGGDFQRNRNLVKSLVDTAPEGLRERLASARLADGRPLFSDPDMLKFFVGIQREINPAGVVVPGSGGSMSESIFTEMAKLEAMMGNRSSEYWKGSNSERLQARYRELVAARAKMEARNKAA